MDKQEKDLAEVVWVFRNVSTQWAIYFREAGEKEFKLLCWHEKGRHPDLVSRVLPALVETARLPNRFLYSSQGAWERHTGAWPATEVFITGGMGVSEWQASAYPRGYSSSLEGIIFPR